MKVFTFTDNPAWNHVRRHRDLSAEAKIGWLGMWERVGMKPVPLTIHESEVAAGYTHPSNVAWDRVRQLPGLSPEAKLAWLFLWALAGGKAGSVTNRFVAVAYDQGRKDADFAVLVWLEELNACGLSGPVAIDGGKFTMQLLEPKPLCEVAAQALRAIAERIVSIVREDDPECPFWTLPLEVSTEAVLELIRADMLKPIVDPAGTLVGMKIRQEDGAWHSVTMGAQ